MSHQLSTSSISSDEKENNENNNISTTRFDYEYIGVLSVSLVDVVHKNIINSNLVHDILRESLPVKFNLNCFCIFDGFVIGKNNNFRDYAHCAQLGCPIKFKFHGITIGLNTQIKVFSTSGRTNHELNLAYELRNSRRIKLQERLKHEKPRLVRNDLVNKMNKNLAEKDGNYQFTHSSTTIRKARSAVLGQNDHDQNDIVDIILRLNEANDNHPYIRKYERPFIIYLGIYEQIEFVM